MAGEKRGYTPEFVAITSAPLSKRLLDVVSARHTIPGHRFPIFELAKGKETMSGFITLEGLPLYFYAQHNFPPGKLLPFFVADPLPTPPDDEKNKVLEIPIVVPEGHTLETFLETVTDRLNLLRGINVNIGRTQDEYRLLLKRASEYKTYWSTHKAYNPLNRLYELREADFDHILTHLQISDAEWKHLTGQQLRDYCKEKLQERSAAYEAFSKRYDSDAYLRGIFSTAVNTLCDELEETERGRQQLEGQTE